MIAAFGTYFCMYAFRKPFINGIYPEITIGALNYKAVLIIAQVIGYMTSKFVGIKVISELQATDRKKLIIGLIFIAEFALLFFGLIPPPFNLALLFFNGLPLGMVWGIIFSYLEGRRFTEILSIGLSISLIISSGIIKTIYFTVQAWMPFVSEFWLPALIGLLFLPLFLMCVWMLSIIPNPTSEDKLLRIERLPMTHTDKITSLNTYGLGIMTLGLIYMMLTTMRDFRDNFSVEIWHEIDINWNRSVFALTETITAVIVLIAIGSLSLIRNKVQGFWATLSLIALGLLISGVSTLCYHYGIINSFLWMLFIGMGMFLAYTPIQVVVFDRMIALFKMKANAGFFIYICDSFGYLGSVGLLLYKEFFAKDLSWMKLLMQFSYILTISCILLLILSACFFMRKLRSQR
ncbi:DUF5690 family protein [Sphingobacterium kitahiroshimense]|uniref:DUF5690 family protein n=1 Tax=Sphingobacterium kitahiroshimense TaxID=470446 RepID=UPI00320A9314